MERRFQAVLWAAVALVFTGMPAAFAQEPETPAPKKITSVEGITEYRYDNGLKVLLFPDPSNPSVTVNLTIFVGSRHEGYGEAGMAHLLEHMLFKGTPDHPDIPGALTGRGASFNGTTWLDRTNYYETLPAKDDNLEFALKFEADRLVNSSIKAEDLASEMSVVRNEFERGENNPLYILNQRMMSAAYQWHNYGKATIGNRADIERVPVESLRAFYRKYYQPDNALLVVAGKFDSEHALELISKYFGTLPRPERKLDPTYTVEPPQDGERLVTLNRVGDAAVVGAVYHIPSGAHPDYPAIEVLNTVLASEPAGRLYKSLVETKKAAAVYGSALALHDPGVLRILAQVTSGNDPRVVLDAMLETLDQTREKGATKEEVDRAKQRILNLFEQTITDSRQLAIQLSEWAAQGDWRLLFLYRDNIERVTAQDVSRVAAQYLKSNNRTVGLFIPTEQPQRVAIPPTPDLADIVGDYRGGEAIAGGEAFDVSPENIVRRTERVTLPSGIEAALLEKKTRGRVVNVRLTLRYGDEENLKNLSKACDLLPVLMTRGTENHTRQELQDELNRLQAKLEATGDAGKVTFTIEVKHENLAAVLKLLGEILRQPTLPADELDILKRERIAMWERKLNDPQSLAFVTGRRVLNRYPEDDPRYVPSIPEEIELIKAIERDALTRLHEQYLGAGHGQLVIIGDFDAKQIVPVFNEILADWKPNQHYARLKRLNPKVEGGVRKIETPDKEAAFYFAATSFPLRDDHPDYPALAVGNFILGEGTLSSRLADRVRQQEGLSYSIGSGLQTLALDRRTAFYIYASCKPENMPKLETAVMEVVKGLLKGVTEKELEAAIQGYLQTKQVERIKDATLAAQLEEHMLADRTMKFTGEIEAAIRELTVEDVNAALKEHIRPDTLFIVEAGDFTGTATTGAAVPKSRKQ